MVLRISSFAAAVAALVLGCTSVERDNPLDAKGDYYIGDLIGSSSSDSWRAEPAPPSSAAISSSSSSLATYTLVTNVSPSEGGTISISPQASSYAQGAKVTVTATASAGYRFAKWSGASASESQSTQITMDGNKALTANFEANKGTFTDSRDGQTYGYVTIGNQVWMSENLNYSTSGSECYDNQDSYCTPYGRLYDWNAAMSACPSGWHLPSNDEWSTLIYYVGGWETAGTKLKAADGWESYSGVPNGTDEFGFAALPGGFGLSGGSFGSAGSFGHWWSATEYDANFAYIRFMFCGGEEVGMNYGDGDKSYCYYSIRCMRD